MLAALDVLERQPDGQRRHAGAQYGGPDDLQDGEDSIHAWSLVFWSRTLEHSTMNQRERLQESRPGFV